MWEAIFTVLIEFYNSLNPTIQVLLILGVLYLVKTGVIRIPVLQKRGVKPIDHSTCPNYQDFLELNKQERSKGERINTIKYFDTIYQQMSLVRTVADAVGDLLTDSYIRLLDGAPELAEQDRSDALQIYSMIIDGAVDDACGYLRKWVKNNGLLHMTEIEYQAYIHKRSEEALKVIKKYIDRKYLKSQLVVGRKEVAEANMVVYYEQVQNMLSDLFIQIRAVSEQSAQRIQAIELE